MGKFKPKAISGFKPKFNAQDFVNGMGIFGNQMAKEFLVFVQDRIRNKHYDFSVVEQRLAIPEGSLKESDMAEHVTVKDHIVFIKAGKVVQEVTYRELFLMFEYGRKDKGILPDPVIRKAIDDFFPIYKLRLRNFLLGKK